MTNVKSCKIGKAWTINDKISNVIKNMYKNLRDVSIKNNKILNEIVHLYRKNIYFLY